MREVLGRLDDDNLKVVLDRWKGEHPEDIGIDLADYALDPRRASWKFFTALPEEGGAAIDIGCGWGVLALSLAENFQEVVAMDLTLERAQMVQKRAEQEGKKNVIAVQGGNSEQLPFLDNSFDLVVLNGVLEWVPCNHAGNPRKIQLQFLGEVRRILKPEGQLYLAIENRYFYGYLRGAIDHHSGLRYAPFLPRWLAHVWSFAQQKRSYRNYLYGYYGYKRLLSQAGFCDSQIFVPWTHYASFSSFWTATPTSCVRSAVSPRSMRKRIALSTLSRLRAFKYFPSSFSIVAAKAVCTPSFAERLAKSVASKVFPDGCGMSIGHMSICAGSDKAVIYLQRDDKIVPGYVAIMGLNGAESKRVREGYDQLNQLWAQPYLSSAVKALIPQPVCSGELGGQYYAVQSRIAGVQAHRFTRNRELTHRALREGERFLSDLHGSSTATLQVASARQVERFTSYLDRLKSRERASISDEACAQAKEFIRKKLQNAVIPIVFGHGDCGLYQFLMDERTTQLSGVIDWEFGAPDDWPLHDWLVLNVSYRELWSDVLVTDGFLGLLEHLSEPGADRDAFLGYVSQLNLSAPAVSGLCVASFFRLVSINAFLADMYYPRRQYRMEEVIASVDQLLDQLLSSAEAVARGIN
ncbi:MAG: methyltransferase domain-containing protein [Lentisphaerae bacterium]|nr:methyltransferase domain-containing protein [Lentisphaerota bacterium]